MAEYPSWVYDLTGANPPILVSNDDQYVALLTAPVPDPLLPLATANAMLQSSGSLLPTPTSALGKVNGITIVAGAVARFVKDPRGTKGRR